MFVHKKGGSTGINQKGSKPASCYKKIKGLKFQESHSNSLLTCLQLQVCCLFRETLLEYAEESPSLAPRPIRFSFSIQHGPFPFLQTPTHHYLVQIRLPFWISVAAANKSYILQIGKSAICGRKKNNPLVGFPRCIGGRWAKGKPWPSITNKKAFPSSPRQPIPLFDNGLPQHLFCES